MPALTSDRNTPRLEGDLREEALAASIKAFAGAILMRNAAGYLTKGATAAGAYGVGVAQEQLDNTAGVAGAMTVTYRKGVHRFDTLAGDPVTIANLPGPTPATASGRWPGAPSRRSTPQTTRSHARRSRA